MFARSYDNTFNEVSLNCSDMNELYNYATVWVETVFITLNVM